jgi:sugar/nucleoside kinase (ribokinase family)
VATAPDFVAVGHVTLDRFGDATRPGGAALYAAVTAHRLGLSTAVLTSHGEDFPLDLVPSPIEVVSVPAPRTTVFEHQLEPPPRSMRVRAAARPIGASDLPDDWRDARIILLAPVLNEVDPLVATAFSGGAVGVAVQGYLRGLDRDGRVVPASWSPPAPLLARVQALFLSREDIGDDPARAVEWFQRVPVGVLTAGRDGAQLFVNGESYRVAACPADEVDATGAGDVFAAAFMVAYERDGDPWQAAAAAACAAALSVRGAGWSAAPDGAALAAALSGYDAEG